MLKIAVIIPQYVNVTANSMSDALISGFILLYENAINVIAKEITHFIAMFKNTLSGGSRIINEHSAPNSDDKIIFKNDGLLCIISATDDKIK